MKHWIALTALAALTAGAHAADPFPGSKPITIVVPFAAGGPTDRVARDLAEALRKPLGGATLIVDNAAGAGSSIGSNKVAKAAPDGYTLVVGSSGTMAINVSLYSKLPYHPLKDFTPISQLAIVPLFLACNPNFPAQTAAELVSMAKAQPGKIHYASAGSGVTSHLTMELFKHAQGIDLVHIPYKGAPAAITDVISGQIDVAVTTAANVAGMAAARLTGVPILCTAQLGMDAQKATDASRQFGAGLGLDIGRFGLSSLDQMLRAGETERGIEQQGLTADYNEFARQRDYPMEQLKFQQSMLQGMPLSTVQSTPNPVSGLQNAVGTATGVASLYEALKKLGLG